MNSEVNALITLCYNSLSPYLETECQLFKGEDCNLLTFMCNTEHGT